MRSLNSIWMNCPTVGKCCRSCSQSQRRSMSGFNWVLSSAFDSMIILFSNHSITYPKRWRIISRTKSKTLSNCWTDREPTLPFNTPTTRGIRCRRWTLWPLIMSPKLTKRKTETRRGTSSHRRLSSTRPQIRSLCMSPTIW